MSVTVSAVPFLLISAVSSVSGIIASIANDIKDNNYSAAKLHLKSDVMVKLFKQDFQTQITDKQTLLKTLKEHGAKNITNNYGNISCDCEQFHLKFIYNGEKPYTMKVSSRSDYGVEELAQDLGTEYCANAQEISYNKIKERLEKQNLSIDEEEIYDDNTIVLTVNLDY